MYISSVTVNTHAVLLSSITFFLTAFVNSILQGKCVTHQFHFLDNSNIKKEHHWKDGLHLNRSGKDLLMNIFLRNLNNFFFKKIKKTRGCDISLSVTSSDEISCGSSTRKLDGANSKKEMKIDSSEEISTNLLNENDTQQSPSYSIKRDEDYAYADAILKSPSFSAPEEINDAKTGLKVMKENSPNKIIVGHLNINSLRNKFEALQFIINRNLDIFLLSETKLVINFL